MMSDKQLLFLYFSTHIFPVAALVLDRTTPGVMKEPPRDAGEGIVSRKVLGELTMMIATMAVIALVMYYTLDRGIFDLGANRLATIQTMILTFVVWGECFNLFNSLSIKHSLIGQIREKSMLLPVLTTLVPVSALTFFMYFGDLGGGMDLVALTAPQYVVSVLLGLGIIPVIEGFKYYVRWSVGKDTRFTRFVRKSSDAGIVRLYRLNDMPRIFQKELGRFIPGKMLTKDGIVSKRISKIGGGIMSAVKRVPERIRDNNELKRFKRK
jgi:magnesium-transporting ATPase (P-type)